MKKYWRMIAAVAVVIAVAVTVSLTSVNWKMSATDEGGDIGGIDIVEQEIILEVPAETAASVEEYVEPESTEPVTEPVPVEPESTEIETAEAEYAVQETETVAEYIEDTSVEAEPETVAAAPVEDGNTEMYTTVEENASEKTTVIAEKSIEATDKKTEAVTIEETTQAETEKETVGEVTGVSIKAELLSGGTVKAGSQIKLTAIVEGSKSIEDIVYQWQYDDGAGWKNIPGATGDTYIIKVNGDNVMYDWRVIAE